MRFDPAELDDQTLRDLRSWLVRILEQRHFSSEADQAETQEMARKTGQEIRERELLKRFFEERTTVRQE